MAKDQWGPNSSSVSDPSTSAGAITPDDNNDLVRVPKAVYVGGDGDITLKMRDDDANVVFKGLKAGSLLPVRAVRIMSAGTTATFLVGLY